MKIIKIQDIPIATVEWMKHFDERIRNDLSFKASGVERLARLIDEDYECAFDGPVMVSIGQLVVKQTARQCRSRRIGSTRSQTQKT